MIFIDPSVKEIYEKFTNNNFIISYLKEKNILLTRSSLYSQGISANIDPSTIVLLKNKEMIMDLAEALHRHMRDLDSKQIKDLISEKIAYTEISYAFRKDPTEFPIDAYKQILYTYKYCSVSSFFQNNSDKFMPDNDFFELSKNEAAAAFYDALMKEFDKLDSILGKCCEYLDFDKIPWDLITYLTQLLGFEKSTIDATMQEENKFRELAKNILDIYRIKGTDYSFELFFGFLGFKLKTREFYFDRRLYYNTNSGGNHETDSTNMFEYEYYLSACNPIDNQLKDIGTNEIVGPEDISPQYSLHEFEDLCEQYGPAAVLGYSPVYNIFNEVTGEVIDTKVYEGKVYKYFKTNLIYYEVGLPNGNPTAQQIKAITKYLDFLTPSYVMRDLKIKHYSKDPDSEDIGFNGDGTKVPDVFGNYNGFELLDGETWNSDFKDRYTTVGEDGKRRVVNEGHYEGTRETYKEYTNSVGKNEFRQPIDYKVINKSANRFLTNSTGNTKLKYKRLNYFLVNKVGDSVVDYSSPTVVIYPYYTVPPYVPYDVPYFDVENRFYEETKNVDLLGVPKKQKKISTYSSNEEDVPSVKEQIRIANISTPIDFLTDKSITDFVKTDERFNDLGPTRIMNRTLVKISEVEYGYGKDFYDFYDCYHKEFTGYNFSNLDQIKIKIYEDEIKDLENSIVTDKTDASERDKKIEEIRNSMDSMVKSQLFTYSDIVYIYTNIDSYKNLTVGNCILSISGDLKNGSLTVYRFGNFRYPNKLSNTYKTDYYNYIKSFDYIVKKDYNGSVSKRKELVGLSAKFISKNNIKEIEEYIEELQKRMINIYLANENSPDMWLDINYITDLLFLNKEDGEYYRAIRNPKVSQFCTAFDEHHIFKNLNEAKDFFFNIHPERKVCNAEFYITGLDEDNKKVEDPYLCALMYTNRKYNSLIYSTKDGMLYVSQGNSKYDIIPCPEFYGRLSIYKKDPNGKYGLVNHSMLSVGNNFDGQKYSIGISDNIEDMYAEISQYDSSWDGYDEIADRDDFIFYNYDNHVRPIKNRTDYVYDEDLKRINEFDPSIEEGYIPDPENPNKDADSYDKNYHYYRTIGQNVIRDISSKTIDNFTSKENINWEYDYKEIIEDIARELSPVEFGLYERPDPKDKKEDPKDIVWTLSKDTKYIEGKIYSTKTTIGILSIIESNLEDVAGSQYADRKYDYYSSASDFLQAYYRIILNNCFETRHFPVSFVKDMFNIKDDDYTTPLPKNFSEEQISKIKHGFKNAILQIAAITENISRDRIYYSYVGNWENMIYSQIRKGKTGVWTTSLPVYCPKLDELWKKDPFAADPLNPKFFEDIYDDPSQDGKEASLGNSLYRYFMEEYKEELGSIELSSYRRYKEFLYSNKDLIEVIKNLSNLSRIVDEHGNTSYPFVAKTNFAENILISKQSLMNKYDGFIDIEKGADPSLLGKDAYSLNDQHVYKDGKYSYQIRKRGKTYIETLELKFGLTEDSNKDFYLPYNLKYGLMNPSKDEYGRHREIYSEFSEMLKLFVRTVYNSEDKELFNYLKQYYYNYLVKDFREKSINDNYPIGLSIKGKRPARIYPKLTERFNGKAGTFSNKSTLLSSYYNEGGYDDTNIKLKFYDLSLTVNKDKVGTIKFKVSHKDFMDAFGYDYNEYYRYLAVSKLNDSDRDRLTKEIKKMYAKQFACVRPIFTFKNLKNANKHYDDFFKENGDNTLWQKIRNKFSIDYPYAFARSCDSDGLSITNENGEPVDRYGNVFTKSEDKIERIKDGFINGYIEIKIVDSYTFTSILNIKELNDFYYNSTDNIYGIIKADEKEYIGGYLSVKELKQSFMDNYVSFPQSLDWILRDENNIVKEYYSFGDDRSVSITKRNVYLDYKEKPKENETKKEKEEREGREYAEKSRNFELMYSHKDPDDPLHYPGLPSLHDEEVMEISKNNLPIDINGKEIVDYDKKIILEDQNITPKYKKVKPVKRFINSSDGDIYNFVRNSEVYEGPGSNNKVSVPFSNCEIVVNEYGEITLKIPSSAIHTSKINKIKLLFTIPWVTLKSVRIFANIFIDTFKLNIINLIKLTKQKINIRLISNALAFVKLIVYSTKGIKISIGSIKDKVNMVSNIINKILESISTFSTKNVFLASNVKENAGNNNFKNKVSKAISKLADLSVPKKLIINNSEISSISYMIACSFDILKINFNYVYDIKNVISNLLSYFDDEDGLLTISMNKLKIKCLIIKMIDKEFNLKISLENKVDIVLLMMMSLDEHFSLESKMEILFNVYSLFQTMANSEKNIYININKLNEKCIYHIYKFVDEKLNYYGKFNTKDPNASAISEESLLNYYGKFNTKDPNASAISEESLLNYYGKFSESASYLLCEVDSLGPTCSSIIKATLGPRE